MTPEQKDWMQWMETLDEQQFANFCDIILIAMAQHLENRRRQQPDATSRSLCDSCPYQKHD